MALMARHNRLLGTKSDIAPILWQNGALARLEKGKTIDPLLKNGYSTISLGYAGLCECVHYMTGKNHITNSYHVHVTEEIDAFEKLKFEAGFQKLSPGGAISYVEVPDMKDNLPAVLAVMKHIYENIMYAELNTKSDYCSRCGYDGEILIITDEHGKLAWECPACGNRDQNTMSVARRTCGYIGTQYWNQGRTQEIKERVLHL